MPNKNGIVIGSDNWFKLFQQKNSNDDSNDKAISKLKTKTNTIIEKMGLEIVRHKTTMNGFDVELDEVKNEMFRLIGGEY